VRDQELHRSNLSLLREFGNIIMGISSFSPFNSLPKQETERLRAFAILDSPVGQEWGTGYHPEQWTEKVAHEIQLGGRQLLEGKGFSRNEPLEQMSFYCFFRLMNGLGCTRLSFRGSRNNIDKYLYIHDQSRRRLWVYFRNDHQDFTF
jgi:hypothetical protein